MKGKKKCKQETCFEFIRQHIKCETKIFIIMQTFNLLKWVSAKNFFSVSSVDIWPIVYKWNLKKKQVKRIEKQMMPNYSFIIWCCITQFKSREHSLKYKKSG